jgi:hypothetical protein
MEVVTSLGSSNFLAKYKSDDQLARMNRARIICRAMTTYLSCGGNGCGRRFKFATVPPSERTSYVWTDPATNFEYVVLGDATGKLLATYRIDTRGKLKRIKDTPLDIYMLHECRWRFVRKINRNLTATMREAA